MRGNLDAKDAEWENLGPEAQGRFRTRYRSHYYSGSLSRTSRTSYFLDSRTFSRFSEDFRGRERGGAP